VRDLERVDVVLLCVSAIESEACMLPSLKVGGHRYFLAL